MTEFLGFFLKFGEKKHIKALSRDGLMYCNTVQYFAESKDNVDRGDEMENVYRVESLGRATIELQPITKNKKLNSAITMFTENIMIRQHHKHHCGNLFCLYGLNFNKYKLNEAFNINDHKLKLGSHCLVITNPREFLNRVRLALDKRRLSHSWNFVKYVDFEGINGPRDIMEKGKEFAYQNEVRFWIDYPVAKPLELKVGNLEDVSQMTTTKKILNSWLLYRESSDTNTEPYEHFAEIDDNQTGS